MRYHIDQGDGNLCNMPGESHALSAPMGEDDYWCSMCARLYNGLSA